MSSIANNLNQVAQMSIQLLGGSQGSVVGQAMAPFSGAAGMQQLQQVFQQLQQALGQMQKLLGSEGGQAAQGGFQAQPGAMSPSSIKIDIRMNPMGTLAQGDQTFGKLPIVGNDSQWPAFSQSANSRITGSDSAKAGLFDGTNPWAKNDGKTGERAAIGWAMQQNDKLRYDADNKQFYTTGADGSRTNAVSLDQVMQTINNSGGANPNNGTGYQAVGNLVNNLPTAAPPPDFSQIMQGLQEFMQMLSGGSAGGASSSLAAGGSGAASGADWSSPAASSSSSGGSSSASGAGSGASSGASGGWGNIDSMMSQAESLMNSDKPSDQLKAQQLMQKAQRMFEMISKMMEQRSQMMSKAIQAIK